MSTADDIVDLLGRLASALASPEPDELAAGVCRLGCDLTGARLALFAPAVSGDGPVLVVLDGSAVGAAPDPAAAPLLAAALAAREPMLIDDVRRFATSEAALQPYGVMADGRVVRSWVTAPVVARDGSSLGAVMAGHPDVRAFGPGDERILVVLGEHLAAALARARLAAERAHVAEALQTTLLPPLLPRIAGLELAARYRPSGAGNLVGGDFYDVFQCGSDEWGVLLGDVSGVGPEAAALTGIARYTARAVAVGASCKPSEVLAAINRALANQRTEDRFCTAVYAALRVVPDGGGGVDVTIASGGHPPAMVLRDDGVVEGRHLDVGLLLGPFEDAEFVDDTVVLGPGDALVLYTDGVTEARDRSGTLFGQRRLAEVVAASAGRTADGIARRVELAASDFQGGAAADDVAVVVARASPAP
jgi:serine phosphatase RsbU (regulator of sigma subunit)